MKKHVAVVLSLKINKISNTVHYFKVFIIIICILQLPEVTFASYITYLEKFGKQHEKKVECLYADKFLICMRHASVDSHINYISGRVGAEMKKMVIYNVDVTFDNHGVICECQCECGAGMGPGAHCKHVAVILYALTEFSRTGTLNVQETCTDNLQSFHKAKRFRGSPVKAEKLTLTTKPATIHSIATIASCDPRPPELQNMENYNRFLRNLTLNYQFGEKCQNMPISQLYEPANLYAVAHDHDYLKYSPEDMFLLQRNISEITENTIKEVEVSIRGQRSNERWARERQFRITSSNFGRICKATTGTDLKKLARDLQRKCSVRCKAIDHGNMYEKTALKKYEEMSGHAVTECGLVICKEYPFLASSPDGLVNEEKVIEIKCPYAARNSPINSSTIIYLQDTPNGLQLDNNHNYYYQIQGEMMCTGRKVCDLVIFTFEDLQVIKVDRDDQFIATMINQLKTFYKEHFKKSLLEKHFYRAYNDYKF